MQQSFTERGFLPERDPLRAFPYDSPLAVLDEIGCDLPSRLIDPGFRDYARGLTIPGWSPPAEPEERLRQLRLYYVRLGFLASGYINQVGQPPVNVLPANLAVPLHRACEVLGRPPILSYDGYALYNWKRFDPAGPIAAQAISTRSRTSCISMMSTGSSWCTWRSRRSRQKSSRRLPRSPALSPLVMQHPSIGRLRRSARQCGGKSVCCGGLPRGWTRRCITKHSGRTSASSSTWSTKESKPGRSISAAKPGHKAASCQCSWN